MRPAPLTLTTREAALRYRVDRPRVSALAKAGLIEAVQVGRTWLVDGDSLEAYLAAPLRRTRPPVPAPVHVPAAPLLRQIALRGGDAACGVEANSAEQMALVRARHSGELTEWMADHLAVHLLAMTPWELWGGEVALHG